MREGWSGGSLAFSVCGIFSRLMARGPSSPYLSEPRFQVLLILFYSEIRSEKEKEFVPKARLGKSFEPFRFGSEITCRSSVFEGGGFFEGGEQSGVKSSRAPLIADIFCRAQLPAG